MGGLSVWHWLIVLAVVVLIFGTKKLRNLGSDLGGAIKGFKEAMHNESAPKDSTENTESAKNISPASPVAKTTRKKSNQPKSRQRTKTSKKPSSTSSGKRDV